MVEQNNTLKEENGNESKQDLNPSLNLQDKGVCWKMSGNTEIYELTCGKCGKVIKSLSENQANFNMKQHKLTHEKEGEDDDKK